MQSLYSYKKTAAMSVLYGTDDAAAFAWSGYYLSGFFALGIRADHYLTYDFLFFRPSLDKRGMIGVMRLRRGPAPLFIPLMLFKRYHQYNILPFKIIILKDDLP